MKNNNEAAYIWNGWRKTYKIAFTAALAITGSESAAFEALLMAMLEVAPKASAAAKLSCVREQALYSCGGEYDALSDAETGSVAYAEDNSRRAAFLRFGCGLGVKDIAGVLDEKTSLVRSRLQDVLLRTECDSKEKAVRCLKRLCRAELAEGRRTPDEASVLRALKKRIEIRDDESELNRVPKRVLQGLISVLLLAAIGIMLWVGSVMFIYIKDKVTLLSREQAVTEVTDGGIQGEN